jgi:hypothetical protein
LGHLSRVAAEVKPREECCWLRLAARQKKEYFWRMSHRITIRLTKNLAAWLEETASRLGFSQGQVVRDQLEKARNNRAQQPFMRLAGCFAGPRDLSNPQRLCHLSKKQAESHPVDLPD